MTEVGDVELSSGGDNNNINPFQRVARLLRAQSDHQNPSSSKDNSNSNNDGSYYSDTISDEGLETRSLGHLSTGGMDDPTLLEEGALPVRQIPRELISEPASLPVSRDVSSENLLETLRSPESGSGSGYGDRRDSGVKYSSRASLNMHQEELRCVIAVVRHADRTPKEKLKINTSEPIILKYFKDHSDDENDCTKDLKIKAKSPMTDFLAAIRAIIAKYEDIQQQASGSDSSSDNNNNNNKVPPPPPLDKNGEKMLLKFKHMRDVLVRWKFSGLNRKLQLKPKKIATDEATGEKTVKVIQLILKWGGDLTKLGENQAIQLGQQFRHSIYPDSP